MWDKIQKAFDRIESRIALWVIIGGSSVMGMISGWISTTSEWISSFGYIGWWFTGLIGALVSMLFILASAWARYAWIKARATQKWKDQTDSLNPLDREFHKMRINIQDLANPFNKRITNKKFTDCEFMGPANLVFLKTGTLSHVGFMDCDVIVVKENIQIVNAIALEDVEIHGGQIWNCTVIIPLSLVPTYREMGADFLSLTGIAELDAPKIVAK